MENKDEEVDEEENYDVRLVELSSSFSKNKYMFYRCLRVVNSLLIASTTLIYSHYYLLRKDEDKAYSYFTSKPIQKSFKSPNDNNPSSKSNIKSESYYSFKSKERQSLQYLVGGSIIFSFISRIVLRLKKRSLTQLLTKVKFSHIHRRKKRKPSQSNVNSDNKEREEFENELKQFEKKKIYLKKSDLKLLEQWKVSLGGIRYWLSDMDIAILVMLLVSLQSETTFYGQLQKIKEKRYLDTMAKAGTDKNTEDWLRTFYALSGEDTQKIEWSEQMQEDTPKGANFPIPDLKELSNALTWGNLPYFAAASLIMTYSAFPLSILWFVLFDDNLEIYRNFVS